MMLIRSKGGGSTDFAFPWGCNSKLFPNDLIPEAEQSTELGGKKSLGSNGSSSETMQYKTFRMHRISKCIRWCELDWGKFLPVMSRWAWVVLGEERYRYFQGVTLKWRTGSCP